VKVLDGFEAAKTAGLVQPVVTVGVFDGVHVGHRFVLDHVVSAARERLVHSVVVTFARHPRALISASAPKLITSLPHRLRLFRALGLDAAVVLPFDEAVRTMEAREFARRLFGEALHASQVVLGYNNRFGRGGKGDLELLKAVGQECGFEARELSDVCVGGNPVSSSRIREAVLEGRLGDASLMLGRPFTILGTVIHGDARGRTLGFPTANLDLHHEVRPPRGVWGCRVRADGLDAFGLVNIGVRPTLGDVPHVEGGWADRDRLEHVEVHLLDVDMDLYGRDLELEFLGKLRDELRCDGLPALKERIALDVREFRARLARAGSR
jgi:riboflavin kinase/FMN adenylyltransferase